MTHKHNYCATMQRLSILLALALLACTPATSGDGPKNAPAVASGPVAPASPLERNELGWSKSYAVVAYGYNYTDTYIDSFEVDGAAGGNLAVSTHDSGGGGHACCASVTSGLPLGTRFSVKWTRDRKRWCEQDVLLTKPIPPEPRYLEVHFYPDGRIEIEVTQRASPPRLRLERYSRGERNVGNNINNDGRYSRCRDGYR